jgi:hypothetical protein
MSDQGSAENLQASGIEEKTQKDKVAYETYQRTLAEAKKAKAERDVLLAEKQAMSDNKLKEQNEWKQFAEQKEKEAADEKAKRAELESTILDSLKLSAFHKHLGGRIKDDAYYQFVDTDRITYNPDTKRVDEESVKVVVADFVKRHSSLVEFKSGKMPNEAASNVTISSKNIEDMTSQEIEQQIKALHSMGRI